MDKKQACWSVTALAATLSLVAACGGSSSTTTPPSTTPADSAADRATTTAATTESPDETTDMSAAEGEAADIVSEERILIGSSGSNSWLPIIYAFENGYFADEGLPNAEYTQIASAPDTANALAAGELQFAGLAVERAVLASQAGRPTACVTAIQDNPPSSLVMSPESGAVPGDWTSLRGLTIGVVQGGWSEIFPQYLVDQTDGIEVEDIAWTSTANTGAMLSALESGQIDGFSGIEPAQRLAIHQGLAEMFYDLEDPANLESDWPTPFLATCLQAQREYAESNPEVVAAVSRAIARALKEFHDSPEVAIEKAAENAPDIERAVWEDSISALLVSWSTDGVLEEAAVENVQQMLVDFGTLPSALPFEELVFTP